MNGEGRPLTKAGPTTTIDDAQNVSPDDTRPGDDSAFEQATIGRSDLRNLPPVEPLIAGVLSRRAAVLMFGPTQVGKTFTALGWMCCVGTGTPWLGRKVHRTPGLYVVGEGAHGLDARVSAWEKAWGVDVDDKDVSFTIKPDSLRNHRTWTEMTATAQARGAGFIVLDTFSSLAWDADEVKDAPLITRWLSNLAVDIDGTAVLIHHPGWGDGERSRGGSQLEANTDEVIRLSGDRGSDLVKLTRKKVKAGPSDEWMLLRRRNLFGSCVMETASASEASEPMKDRIVAVLRLLGGDGAPTGPQLCKELGVDDANRSTVYKPLRDLVGEGVVVREGTRGRACYRLLEGALFDE